LSSPEGDDLRPSPGPPDLPILTPSSQGGGMYCPMCGCTVEVPGPNQPVVECDCCGTVWLVEEQTHQLARVLVGAEG
jgi:hypothetical protein